MDDMSTEFDEGEDWSDADDQAFSDALESLDLDLDAYALDADDQASDAAQALELDALADAEAEALSDAEAFSEAEDLQAAEPDDQNELPDRVTQEMLDAWAKDPLDRTPHEVELVDMLQAPEFDAQRSYAVDDAGRAITDETGEIIDVPYATKGSQRPDGYHFDPEEGMTYLWECKDYSDLNNLKHNMKNQYDLRKTAFGDNLDLTFSVTPKFSVAEAEELTKYVEEDLGCHIQYQTR